MKAEIIGYKKDLYHISTLLVKKVKYLRITIHGDISGGDIPAKKPMAK